MHALTYSPDEHAPALRTPTEYIQSVRVSERSEAAFAVDLAGTALAETRRHIRFPLSSRFPMFVRLMQPSKSPRFVRVSPRDICGRGVGFLHAASIAPMQPCEVTIRLRDGHPRTLHACIAHCQLVRGGVYAVGAAFESDIDIATVLPIPEAPGSARGSDGCAGLNAAEAGYERIAELAADLASAAGERMPAAVLAAALSRLNEAASKLGATPTTA